jgi:hypothetical protein
MKKYLLVLPPALLLVSILGLWGCNSSSPPIAKDAKPIASHSNEKRRLGLDVLKQATSTARCAEGLQLLNADLQQNPERRQQLTPSTETQKALQDLVGLSSEELQEVASPTYRASDAHYLAECFLLRDAARSLDITGLPADELANRAFRWVLRRVLLHQQGEDWLPPAQVLQRGFGSSRDRARVLLALLPQLQLNGCLLIVPGTADEVVLAGVFSMPAQDIYLFDVRRGLAVRTADGKIATLTAAQADPKVLQVSGLNADQFKAVQLRVACPLNSLPSRMQELEKALRVQDRIVLACDPITLVRDLGKASGMPVQVWNSPPVGERLENSPTRVLRLFLPAEDGGIDKSDRLRRYPSGLVPLTGVGQALEQIKLGRDQLTPRALDQLIRLIGDMLEKFDLQPRGQLMRGKGAELVQRLERVREFLDDESNIGLANDLGFQRAVADWRDKAQQAYTAPDENQAQALVKNLWAEDQFALTMLQVDAEERPINQGRGDERPPPPKKAALTAILAHVTRDYLARRALWLRAMVWHEKAERDQLRSQLAKDKPQLAASARSDWQNTNAAWKQFLDQAVLSPGARNRRLESIRAVAKRGGAAALTTAAHLLEELHLELQQQFAGRLHLARAAYFDEGPKSALALLHSLDDDLAALLAKGKNDQPGLKADVDEVRQRLNAPTDSPVAQSLELLGHDWAPHGNYFWLRQHIHGLIEEWEKGTP